MVYATLADGVLIVHLGFVLFVVFGGMLAFLWRWMAWVHLPAALWGALVEMAGMLCPLTTLEVALRRAAGGPGYEATFVERYLVPVVYPPGLTREVQMALGAVVLGVNLAVYGALWRTIRRARGRGNTD